AVMAASIKRIDATVNEIPKIKIDDDFQKITNTSREKKSLMLVELIQPMITEFQALAAEVNKQIDFVFHPEDSEFELFVDVDPVLFRRMMANLVRNSIDAIERKGGIGILLTEPRPGTVEIVINDNGIGIPNDLLSKVGKLSFTTKEHGSGIGLSTAVEYVRSWGGNLTVQSGVDIGTTVVVTLPLARKNDLYLSAIIIPPDADVIVLDDDPTVHEIWQTRFRKMCIDRESPNIFTYFKPKDARKGITELRKNKRDFVLLVDYDLGSDSENGVAFVRDIHAQRNAILISGIADDPGVIKQCEEEKIPMVPKWIQSAIPICIG
ncbi:MAG: hypothetical protein C5B47_01735, partial [Verrucomicrobia bacterium]